MAKCAPEKKLCVLFIGLAQFFRLSYSYFIVKGVIYGYKSKEFFSLAVRNMGSVIYKVFFLIRIKINYLVLFIISLPVSVK